MMRLYNFLCDTVCTDLIEDWSSKARPDVTKFIPYTVNVCVLLKEFELTTVTNEWNWIDCFGHNQENGRLTVPPFLAIKIPSGFFLDGPKFVATVQKKEGEYFCIMQSIKQSRPAYIAPCRSLSHS